MKYEIEAQFNVGDKVWHKNLVTHEPEQHTVQSITLTKCVYKHNKTGEEIQTELVIYHTDDGPLTNVPGKPDCNSAYVTKEEAMAAPDYVPDERWRL